MKRRVKKSKIVHFDSALPEHEGTVYRVNFDHIVSYYKSVDPTMDKTVVYMTDGRVYDVKETPEEIDMLYDEQYGVEDAE